jgi:hypothetical protein
MGRNVRGMCIGAGVAVAVAALLAERTRRAAHELAAATGTATGTAAPAHYRHSGARTAIGVSGTILSPPTLRAPLTERPCVLWDLALFRERDRVWAAGRIQDLEIGYDVRRQRDEARPPDRPAFVPGPGTVKIDAHRIVIESLTVPPSKDVEVVEVRPSAETLPLLRDLGAPKALLEGIESEPDRYRLVVASMGHGAFVRCVQEHPDADVLLFPGSVDEHLAHGRR